jgi:transposase InsO family protein
MDIHKNARTTPHSRALIARRLAAGERPAVVARELGVCKRTVRKWAARAAEGELALEDRSCRPHGSPRATSTGLMVEMERLRRRWRWTGAQIAESVGVSRATAARTLRQLGLARLDALEPVAAGRRYEWARPGQLLHLDIKKLGRIGQVGHRITGDRRQRTRGIGWEFVHVCIDDCSRVAYVEVLPDERSVTVVGFLRRALTWFARRGVAGERILTDNGSAYRSRLLAAVCRARHLAQRFTRPYTPRTNGKAERFIQTLLREWAYRIPYPSSAYRTAVLARWLHYYNWHRRHSALHGRPPISRVLSQDNLLRLHS